MNISSEDFKQSILELDSALVQKIKRGEKLTESSDEHINKIKKLLLNSAKSSDWENITDHIAYLIYAGGVQDYLLHQTIDGALNPLITKHNTDEFIKIANARKGGIAKAARNIDIKAKIISVWNSGKYTSKDICAEQESSDTGYSFATIRKWLRNQ